jgi:uncharacterized protein
MDPVAKILSENKIIAVVGLSDNPAKASYDVARYLQAQGYKIIPVNPNISNVLGETSYPDLEAIPGPIDIVDIFRNPDAVPIIVEQAIAKKAKVVWMQPGAENLKAAERATEVGLEVIVGVCMMREHRAQVQ